jgi:valyl-tRNA synthetase
VSPTSNAGLVAKVEDRAIEIDHSDRSKTPIEPWLSQQWFVHMADVDGGVVMGRGTAKEFTVAGLAQAALDAEAGRLPPLPDGRPRPRVRFHPDEERYRKMHDQWLAEKRDWCISRQLWWQIPAAGTGASTCCGQGRRSQLQKPTSRPGSAADGSRLAG